MADLDVQNRGVHLLTPPLMYNINKKSNCMIQTMIVYVVQTFQIFFLTNVPSRISTLEKLTSNNNTTIFLFLEKIVVPLLRRLLLRFFIF